MVHVSFSAGRGRGGRGYMKTSVGSDDFWFSNLLSRCCDGNQGGIRHISNSIGWIRVKLFVSGGINLVFLNPVDINGVCMRHMLQSYC